MRRPDIAKLLLIRRLRRETAEAGMARARRVEAECQNRTMSLRAERADRVMALEQARNGVLPTRLGIVTALERNAAILMCEAMSEDLRECEGRVIEAEEAWRKALQAFAEARARFVAAFRREEAVSILDDDLRHQDILKDDRTHDLASEDWRRIAETALPT